MLWTLGSCVFAGVCAYAAWRISRRVNNMEQYFASEVEYMSSRFTNLDNHVCLLMSSFREDFSSTLVKMREDLVKIREDVSCIESDLYAEIADINNTIDRMDEEIDVITDNTPTNEDEEKIAMINDQLLLLRPYIQYQACKQLIEATNENKKELLARMREAKKDMN